MCQMINRVKEKKNIPHKKLHKVTYSSQSAHVASANTLHLWVIF